MALFFLRSAPLTYMVEGSIWNGTESNVNPWTVKITARLNDKNTYASSLQYCFYDGGFGPWADWKFTDVSILVLEVIKIHPHPHRPGFCPIYRNPA